MNITFTPWAIMVQIEIGGNAFKLYVYVYGIIDINTKSTNIG